MVRTQDSSRRLLKQWRSWQSLRDTIVREAYGSGMTKTEIHKLTGVARTTIDRIISKESRK